MGQGFDYAVAYLRSLNKRQVVWSLCGLACVLAALVYLKTVRPDLRFMYRTPHIYVVNKGELNALIKRVDGFFYQAGRIAYVTNTPKIRQTVEHGSDPEPLQIGKTPPLEGMAAGGGPYYLKLAVRYQIPSIPLFRYTSLLYLKYDPTCLCWEQDDNIPSRYRSLGNVGTGDVDMIQLNFEQPVHLE